MEAFAEDIGDVFPTPVGMSHTPLRTVFTVQGVPHAHGDEPR